MKKKTNKPYSASCKALAALLISMSQAAHAADVSDFFSAFEFNQIDYVYPDAGGQQPNSTWGNLQVVDPSLLTGVLGTAGFLNIGDGSGSNAGWLVKNLYVDPFDSVTDLTHSFDFGLGSPADVTGLNIHIDFSAAPSNTAPSGTQKNHTVGTSQWGAQGAGNQNVNTTTAIGNPGIILDAIWNAAVGATVVTVSQPNPVNVQAAQNQCFPMSIANSLQWLENEHSGFNVPDNHVAGENGDGSLVGELDAARTVTSRTNGQGTWFKPMLETKFDYLKANNLDGKMDMKHQGVGYGGAGNQLPAGDFTHNGVTSKSQGARPTLAWIQQQLEAGEDVEIVWTYEDDTGNIMGGHAVRVFEMGTTLGIPWIGYVHDAVQAGSGTNADTTGLETRREFVGDTDSDNFLNIGANNREIIFAMAESVVPEPGTYALLGSMTLISALRKRKRTQA